MILHVLIAMVAGWLQRHQQQVISSLLEENRDELVEAARQCLDAELAKRGLTQSAKEAEERPSTDPGDEMVAAAVYSNGEEADLARSLLESAGIPCFLGNEHTAGFTFTLPNDISGLPLLVPARCLDQAREILAAPVSDEDLAAEAEAAGKQADQDSQK